MREFQAFRLQYRVSERHSLLLGGRIFLQYIVDAWCCIERGRLKWVELHQSIIRSELYNNIVDSFSRGDVSAADVGKRIVLPSSFTGGNRYMQQNYQDSLAVCKEYGHPDLFVTFTCNPQWVEIQRALAATGCRDASARPDIVARVFKLKLDAMMSDFTKKDVLGRVLAADGDKILSTTDNDSIISAELFDKEVDNVAYQAVAQFMMHGPCGAANPREPYVQRLYFHLEDEQEVLFRDDEALPQIIGRFRPDSSMFVQWLLNNRRDESGRDLTYVRYPIRYRWDNAGKFWAARKQKIDVVGRMVYAHPASGERFYMRLLLNHVASAKSFEDIRTVDGIVYPTYKEACFHRVSNPSELWDKHWVSLADDVEFTHRKMLNFPSLVMTDCDKQIFALDAINTLLNQHGKSVSDYPELPEINTTSTTKFRNQLLLEEMMYDRQMLGIQAAKQIGCLNNMHRLVFDKVMQSAEE
ncbi:hypothetical protein AgCh_033567 [Apium graveolens]